MKALLKGGFIRVCVEINVSKPLVLGLFFGILKESDWQEFIYENVGFFLLLLDCEVSFIQLHFTY